MKSTEIKDLAAALVNVQKDMAPIKRTCENPYFHSDYADLAAIWQAVRGLLAKNGLCVIQTGDVSINGNPVIITTLVHTSGQWMSGIMPLVAANDKDPQKIVAGVTYMRRAGLSAIIGACQEGEDDDGNKAAEGAPKQEQPRAPAPATPPPPAPPAHTADAPKEKGEVRTETMTFEPAKPGKTKAGKTVYRYRGGDEKFYSTFAADVAKAMDALVGEICNVQFEVTHNGQYENRKILTVRKAPTPGAPAQEQGQDDDNINF